MFNLALLTEAYRNKSVPRVDGISSLRAIAPENGEYIYLSYHTTEGDGGHGVFRGVTGALSGTYTDDNGITIVPTGGNGSAAWIREFSGAVNVKWVGAKGNGATDDTTAIQSAIDYVASNGGGVVFFPQGEYKVTSITLKENVSLKGQKSVSGLTTESTWLNGTTGYNVITIATPQAGASTTNMEIDGVSITGGDRGIVSYEQTVWLSVKNLRIYSPVYECFHVKGFMQDLYIEEVDFLGGTYGYRQEAVTGPVTGATSLLDKSLFSHVRASGQSENGIRIEASYSNSVTLLRVTCNNTGRHGMYIDAGVSQLQIIDANFEAIGYSDRGKSVRSTGSISSGSTTLTVSTTGFQNGDILTIAGAGQYGRDLEATVVSGGGTTTLTLSASASTTVSNVEVINDRYDCIFIDNTNGSNSGITIIGMAGTDGVAGAYTRYGINDQTGGATQLIGCNPVRPAYDPSLSIRVFGGQVDHRVPSSLSIYNFLATTLPLKGQRAVIGSPKGGDIILGLEDSNANGTGNTGSVQIRLHNANRTRVLQIDGTTSPPSNQTVMVLAWHDGTAYRFDRVAVGPADSGGAGYRVLRVPN